jgi:hypothetical protein
MTRKLILLWAVVGGACLGVVALSMDFSRLQWTCQHAILKPDPVYPTGDELRGIALTTNGSHLYLGCYAGMVYKVVNDMNATTTNQFAGNTVVRLRGHIGKAVATDDRGRVYVTDGSSTPSAPIVWWPTGGSPVTNSVTNYVKGIHIYDSTLSNRLYSIARNNCEGVALRREGEALVLYATDRSDKTVTRWELAEDGEAVTNHTQRGLDGDGQITVPYDPTDLRGMAVDRNNYIWMATMGAVYRCYTNGTDWTSNNLSAPTPIDVCCDDNYAYLTRRGNPLGGGTTDSELYGEIHVMNLSNMSAVAHLSRPAPSVSGVTDGTFLCLEKAPNGDRVYVTMADRSGAGYLPYLTIDSNWKLPVLRLESLPPPVDGTVFRIR